MENQELVKILQNSENHIAVLHNAIDVLKSENAELQAENETWQRVSDSTDKMEMSAVAKILNYPGLGRNKIFKILREIKVLRYNNEPYQSYIDSGHFDVIEQEVNLELL